MVRQSISNLDNICFNNFLMKFCCELLLAHSYNKFVL